MSFRLVANQRVTLGMICFCLLNPALGACQSPQTQAAKDATQPAVPATMDAPVIILHETDNGKTVPLVKGAKIHIALDGNATTGFSWTVTKVEGASCVQNGDVVYRTAAQPGMVGSGGVSSVDFDAKDVGKTTITMEYKRPWEKETPAARTLTLTLDVKAAK